MSEQSIDILEKSYSPDHGTWICGRCHVPLEQKDAYTHYGHAGLHIILPRCPKCGLTLVPKSLAEGQLLDMQKRMEDASY